jgi:hypothetical protein
VDLSITENENGLKFCPSMLPQRQINIFLYLDLPHYLVSSENDGLVFYV